MSVFRVKHQKNYVVINKRPLEDPKLSFKAKGLWAYCMSRPDDWEFHISHLKKVSKEGEDAIYSAVKELIENGYCRRVQENKGKGAGKGRGSFGKMDYIIYEEPIQKNFTQPDFPDAENQRPKNPALLSNDSNQVKTYTSSPPPLPPKKKVPPTSYTEEEEEYFSQRMKELPKPPKHVSPAYKATVIQSRRDDPEVQKKKDILQARESREKDFEQNSIKAKKLEAEYKTSTSPWRTQLTFGADGVIFVRTDRGTAIISPYQSAQDWDKAIDKWRNK